MAAATTILAGAGIAGGIGKAIGGAKQKREAKRAARNFRRQQLKNVNRGRRISTRGAELAREEIARGTGTTVEALRSGGVRGVVGGAGDVQENITRASREIGRDLDIQQVQLDRDIAADDANIRAIQERREQQELGEIQGQVDAGNQQMFSGFGDVLQSGFGAATAGFGTTRTTPFVDPVAVNPQGVAPVGDPNIIAPVFLG